MHGSVVEGRTLRLSGDVDVRCTAEVRRVLYELLGDSERDVIVDLSGVDSVDTTALKMFAVASRVAERTGRRLVLDGCPPAVRRLLHLTRLRWLLQVAPATSGRAVVEQRRARPDL